MPHEHLADLDGLRSHLLQRDAANVERPTLQTLPFVESAGKRGQHKEKLVGQIVQVPDLELPVLLAHQALRVQESLQILGPKGHRYRVSIYLM